MGNKSIKLIKDIKTGNFKGVQATLSGMNEDNFKILMNKTFMHKNTMLHYVFSSGNKEIIDLFLSKVIEHELDYEGLVGKQNRGGYAPVDRLLQKHPDYMRTLFKSLSSKNTTMLNNSLATEGIGGNIIKKVSDTQYINETS